MFSTTSWLALTTALLACAVVFCEERSYSDSCGSHPSGRGRSLRPNPSQSFEDFQASIDDYKKGSSATKAAHDHSEHPSRPLKWEVKKTNLVTTEACTATQTTATHVELCRGEEISWSFQTTRARTPTWRSTITEEIYIRITDTSNTTIITMVDKIWAPDIEETHITESVFSDLIDSSDVSRDMTWGTQKNSFIGDGIVPCDATIWRLSIGYRGSGYDAQKDCACAAYVATCAGGTGLQLSPSRYEKLLLADDCPPTCRPTDVLS